MRRMGPLKENHPLVKDQCHACQRPFEVGQYVTLVPLGPGENAEARRKAREGKHFNAIAVPVHWACATGEEDNHG